VIKADLVGKACMSDILSAVAALHGIKSMDIDADKCTLTVVGTADPVRIAQRLKKKCFAATIVSVAEDKPKPKEEPKKDACKEACEKLCKERCDKLPCCKECKEKCEKACKERCESRCKAWIEGCSCSCSRCCSTSPGFCYTPGYPYYGCRCGRGCGGWPGPFSC
jgi:hypothetical protein